MSDLRSEARQIAKSQGIDPDVFVALINQESGFNPGAKSPMGAVGLTQLMPGTARGLGVNPNDPRQNLVGGAKYLKQQLDKFGSYRKALAAYNAGPGAVEKYNGVPPYAETQNYVNVILSHSGTPKRTSRAGTGSSGSPSVRTTMEVPTETTIPGQSFAAERQAATLDFLGQRGSDADQNLSFAMQMRGLRDIPAKKIPGTKTVSVASSPSETSTQRASSKAFSASHSPLLELIHSTDNGPGYAVKDGKKVDGASFYSSVWAGHRDHVHVAAGKKTIVQLGKLAQQMGLNVGENPHFGGVDPVHVPGSYHYRGEAIDVSGDPRKMDAYAKRVERLYGIR